MLQLFHNPVNDSTPPDYNGYSIDLDIEPLSDFGLIDSSIMVYWKTNSMFDYNNSSLHMDQNHANRWYGWIPPLYQLDTIKYFIQASDSSGRVERHPLQVA